MIFCQEKNQRCVFDKGNREESSAKNITVESESVEEKNNVKIECIEEENKTVALQPKKKGNKLFTITSNIKIANGRYMVSRIVEEMSEKKARIVFEKQLKKDFGKLRSLTKFQIKEYQCGDKEMTEEIIDKVLVEEKEISLFDKALEVLCTSPYIHLYKIPSPNLGNGKFQYGLFSDMEHLKESMREDLNKVIDNAREDEGKEIFKLFVQKNEKLYSKMVNGAKQMSGKEIKNDKNAIKFIGGKDDSYYNAILNIHKDEEEKEKHKLEMAKENLIKVTSTKDMILYKTRINGLPNSDVIVVARDEKQAKTLSLCSDYIREIIQKNSNMDIADELLGMEVTEIKDDAIQEILENIEVYLNRETITTVALTSSKFSIELFEAILDKICNFSKLTQQEKEQHLQKIIDSKTISKMELSKLLDKVVSGGKEWKENL